jgi:hypothetical protein
LLRQCWCFHQHSISLVVGQKTNNGEAAKGIDQQLEKSIEVLLKEVNE